MKDAIKDTIGKHISGVVVKQCAKGNPSSQVFFLFKGNMHAMITWRTISIRVAKEDVPVRINVPGAKARQQTEFGDVSGYGKMGAEYFSLGAGTDITELLYGLEGDSCQCPHRGRVIERAGYDTGIAMTRKSSAAKEALCRRTWNPRI